MSPCQCSGAMLDEMADGFSPAMDVGDIVGNRFEPKMSGKDAPIGGGQLLVRDYGFSLYQSIPKDGLDFVG